MLAALDRKAVRNLLQMKGQFLAIALVIACGVAAFVMSLSTLSTLKRNQTEYYARYRFADIFARVTRAPLSVVDRIAEIPGVAQVAPRILSDVTLDLEDLPEPAIGRLISIPEQQLPDLNGLHLRTGRYIEPNQSGEVIASEAFAEEHGLMPGDALRAVLNGRERTLRIVGIAISPEFIFQIREGDVLPDDKRFGVLWMGQTDLAAAFDMQGAFNNLAVTVSSGASQPEIIRQIDLLLEPYGCLGAYDRNDHSSHRYIRDEMEQLKSMARVGPTIFLSVAAFLLNVVLSRLIATQREEIAALKAFGYFGWDIGLHFMKMMAVVVCTGGLLGTAVGTFMGMRLSQLYTTLYRFPHLDFQFDGRVALAAFGVSLTAGVLGTIGSVWQAVRLPPAEAMRPAPPGDFRPTFLERMGFQRFIPQTMRMILRSLERSPIKSALSCLGISTAVAVIILGSYAKDAVDYVMESQFRHAQRHDLMVTFVRATQADALHDLENLPGVHTVVPMRSIPVRMRSGHHTRRVAIQGLPPGNPLFKAVDVLRNEQRIPEEGVLMTSKLAEVLELKVGDTAIAEVLEGERPHLPLKLMGTVDDFSGLSCYVSETTAHRMLREGSTLSGAFVTVDSQRVNQLYTQLKNLPQVAGVSIKVAMIQSFRETIAENLLRIRLFNVGFATIIAFGVVYNAARISLAERSRELATLRVIGFSRAEISGILLGELAVLTIVALLPGLGLGYLFCIVSTMSLNTEMYRIPLVINPATHGFACGVICVAAILSGLVVRRRLDELDLIAVLKTRE
ncbi:MAG: ABC transporter permease [Planctomycetota bacterium]|nr:MAG: ABC transporter permease [Planctomycetota bacterium]